MRKVLGSFISPFVRKVLLALEHKGLPYDHDHVTPLNLPDGYHRYSPLGKIPAFVDDTVEICDSSVICQYLEDRHPETPLYPKDPACAARARWLEEYADTKLLEVLGPPLFFERFVKPRFLTQPTDEARVAANLENGIPPVLDYLERVAPAEGFLVGPDLSIADLAVPAFFVNARMVGFEVDATRWPKLAAYLSRVFATEVWKKRLASEQQALARFA
jgi:glutathione S-transferase